MTAQYELLRLSKWIDAGNAGRDPEAVTLHRVIKLAEEAGEVVTALIGALGANPRKGVTNGMEKVLDELLDVAITALGAYEHLDGHSGHALYRLERKIEAVVKRAVPCDHTKYALLNEDGSLQRCLVCDYEPTGAGPSVQEPEHMNLAPITDDDLLRIANRPGGINEQLRAAMDARDHQNRSNEGENR